MKVRTQLSSRFPRCPRPLPRRKPKSASPTSADIRRCANWRTRVRPLPLGRPPSRRLDAPRRAFYGYGLPRSALPYNVSVAVEQNARLLRMQVEVGALRAECEIGSCHLPACKTILDVVGDLFADVCQVEEFFLDDRIFGLFGKLSIRGRLLPEIVVPLHTYLPRND